MSDSNGFAGDDDDGHFDPDDPQVQRLTAMARFARRVINIPWFERVGRVLTPGLVMSISKKLMPVCLAAVSVRTRQKIQSASSA